MKEEFEKAGFKLERVGWRCVYCSEIFDDIAKRDKHGIKEGTEIEDSKARQEVLEEYYKREQVFEIIEKGDILLVPEKHRWILDD